MSPVGSALYSSRTPSRAQGPGTGYVCVSRAPRGPGSEQLRAGVNSAAATGAFQAPPAESRPSKMLQKSLPSSGPREGCHNKKLCPEGWTTSSVGVNVLYEKENPTKLIKHKHSPSARRTQHGCLHKVHHKLLVLGIPYATKVGLVIKIYHSI